MTTLKCFIADIIIKTPLSQNQNYKCYQLITPKHDAIIFDNFGETIYVATNNFKYRIMKNI